MSVSAAVQEYWSEMGESWCSKLDSCFAIREMRFFVVPHGIQFLNETVVFH